MIPPLPGNLPLPPTLAAALAALDPPLPAGPLLYTLARAQRPRGLLVAGSAAAALWLAAAAPAGATLQVQGITTLPPDLAHIEGLTLQEGTEAPTAPLALAYLAASPVALDEAHLAPHPLLLLETGVALPAALADATPWRQLPLPAHGVTLASRAPRPAPPWESAREALIALLLAALQPPNLILGANIVFDGSVRPANSKINFSGTGGPIGAGDLLLVQPNDLDRFNPLPGAVALVLGELLAPVQGLALPISLPDGDLVTLVTKEVP